MQYYPIISCDMILVIILLMILWVCSLREQYFHPTTIEWLNLCDFHIILIITYNRCEQYYHHPAWFQIICTFYTILTSFHAAHDSDHHLSLMILWVCSLREQYYHPSFG